MAQFSLMSIEELKLRGIDDLAQLLRASENEKLRLTAEHSRTMKEVNRKLQASVHEIQCLQEHNKKLLEEHEELRDLCCFLDSTSQKEQRAIKEWQKFGKYTSDAMQSNVKTVHNKLNSLEASLDRLIKENIELKELCLLLADDRPHEIDQENLQVCRDAGDGSSGSSPSNEKIPIHVMANRNYNIRDNLSVLNDDAIHYLRYLETRVSYLETENSRLLQENQLKFPDYQDYRKFVLTAEPSSGTKKLRGMQLPMVMNVSQTENSSSRIKSQHDDEMDESEKTIVRQMCSVVCRKFGDTVSGYKTAV